MKNTPIIGLAGFSGTGKSTIAEHLALRWGYTEFAIADNVRDHILDADFLAVDSTPISEIVERHGWEGAKNHRRYGSEVVRLLQVVGDLGRSLAGPRAWIDLIERDLAPALASGGAVVISDVRLDEEARWVRERGGVVWEVVRPGVGPRGNHVTESGIGADLVDEVIFCDFRLPPTQQQSRALSESIERSLQASAHRLAQPLSA